MIDLESMQHDVKHRAFYATMAQLAAAGRRMRRRRDKRVKRKSLLRLLMPDQTPAEVGTPSAPDPVRVAVLAIDGVARASMRASFTGIAMEVTAPDEATAAVLRAALAETGRNRATDRLVRITVGCPAVVG